MSREKNRALRKFSIILLLLLLSIGAWAQGGPPPGGGMPPGMFGVDTSKPTSNDVTTYTAQNFLSLVHQTDIRSSFYDSDMTATITMVSVSPEKGTMTRKEIIYRRDKDDAFLMLTLEPESRKGQGMLRVDNNMWRYDPTSRKFTHTTLKAQYEDTTVRNNDFRRSQRALDYSVTSLTSGTLGKYNVWIAELKANNDEVPFPYIKMWIDKEHTVVLKVEEYSLSKKLLRTSYYTNYVQIGTSYVPTVQIFQDGLIPEKRTQVTYTNISTKPVPNDVFTKNYLERMSQ
ncbi:MAG TPA: outer membrane lipoprotein-sorting protein [Spirochaetales bacterium]|nr:outer membrane lipoprotein-sorting protein [Spirochaetales bacterium]